jgi:transcriptional regulator with XRE-family HTH domain
VVADENLKIHIDLQQFFQHYKVLNSRFLAQKIGMNATLLSQYVRGRKKPSARQTEKILNGIKSIGRELADLQLV